MRAQQRACCCAQRGGEVPARTASFRAIERQTHTKLCCIAHAVNANKHDDAESTVQSTQRAAAESRRTTSMLQLRSDTCKHKCCSMSDYVVHTSSVFVVQCWAVIERGAAKVAEHRTARATSGHGEYNREETSQS